MAALAGCRAPNSARPRSDSWPLCADAHRRVRCTFSTAWKFRFPHAGYRAEPSWPLCSAAPRTGAPPGGRSTPPGSSRRSSSPNRGLPTLSVLRRPRRSPLPEKKKKKHRVTTRSDPCPPQLDHHPHPQRTRTHRVPAKHAADHHSTALTLHHVSGDCPSAFGDHRPPPTACVHIDNHVDRTSPGLLSREGGPCPHRVDEYGCSGRQRLTMERTRLRISADSPPRDLGRRLRPCLMLKPRLQRT